ncbi:hypothetical protein CVD28_01120 [Bacillus sp. M6-12]|uniref:hypothetical protein n=1 Tax=Bacillus sp. M6-12 TaxID=2054166 RepID=UPI000C78AC47|nr:hypothetical protein [Bacillus sp. M6-12]PLS19035.1 hypothetical protein CVD28_01120 [Bacillus sp. M6-12]
MYYLLKTENDEVMILTTRKEHEKEEILSLCKEGYSNGEVKPLLCSLQKAGILRCFTLTSPRYAFTILLKNNGEVEVVKHTQYSIVAFAENGRLMRVESKTYDIREEAEERMKKLQEAYVCNLFIAEK